MLSFVYTTHKFVAIIHPQANPQVLPDDGDGEIDVVGRDQEGGNGDGDLAEPLVGR